MQGTSRWVAGGLVSALGIIGLFLAAGAHDAGVYLFGLALFAFGLFFVFSQIKQGYDAAERAAHHSGPSTRPGQH
jgi:hypothetical protein